MKEEQNKQFARDCFYRIAAVHAAVGDYPTQLKTYERFLPSLDLKRKQLMAERIKARSRLVETERVMEGLRARVGTALPRPSPLR